MALDEESRRTLKLQLLISTVAAVIALGGSWLVGTLLLHYPLVPALTVGNVLLMTVVLVLRGVWPGFGAGAEFFIVLLLGSLWGQPTLPSIARWTLTGALVVLPAVGFAVGRLYRLRRMEGR